MVGHWPLVKRRKTNKERFWRVLLGKRIWSPLVESHVNAMTQMTNPFFGGWRREDKRLGGFCWWSAEEEAKENTLSDVEELLNASWNHSFTFQFRTTALHWGDVKKIRQKYKENTKEMQRKILSVTLNANWILHFKFWPLHWESRHNLAMLNFFPNLKSNLILSFHISILYPMKREEGTPKNAQSYNKIYDRSKRSR